MNTIKVSIVGVTGFTGAELLRVLLPHPRVEFAYLTSRQHERSAIGEIFPRLSREDLFVTNTDYATVAAESDVVFLCLPHKASQDVIDAFLGKTKVIDMSADFRLDDAATYEKFYAVPHTKPEHLNGRFVYGAPELHREALKSADAIANPGCNALLCQLMLYPFAGIIDHADIMLMTGTSGGGRSPRDPIDHPVLSGNIRSYQVNSHRHTPEIIRTAQITEEQLNFTPTVGPYSRGLFATAFVTTSGQPNRDIYNGEPFARMCEKVELTNIISTNYADISITEGRGGEFIVQGAMDNLLRGAAGTAMQNMNLMCGFPEDTALNFTSAVYP